MSVSHQIPDVSSDISDSKAYEQFVPVTHLVYLAGQAFVWVKNVWPKYLLHQMQ
jgi:hypothetical protein